MLHRFFIVVFAFLLPICLYAEFDFCRFNFGTDWDYVSKNESSSVSKAVDYITIWLNDPSFNQYWHGSMLNYCKSNSKTPVFYSYIIAKASGLGDADQGGKLATDGAGWLKSNFNQVKSRYENYAQNTASIYGTSNQVIWLMEPDYYQYFSGNQNVKLSFSDASDYMNQLIAIVKKHLPNALISIDISPWNNDQSSYINAFDKSAFTFMHTSGGRTEAGNSRIRMDNNNNVTWAAVSSASGNGIIADDGYGAGGGSTGHDASWDSESNLIARIKDGVVAITQKSPDSNWGSTITKLKSSLSGQKTKSCGNSPAKTYVLTVTVGTGGSVTKKPDKSEYASGENVELTAVASSGYVFKNWIGDVSGTGTKVTVTMSVNKSVSAAFEKLAENTFSLNVNITGSGTVSRSPQSNSYSMGTEVTLIATPIPGVSAFESWGGDVSGSNSSVKVTMNANKTVNVRFRDTSTVKVDTLKKEAEQFNRKNGDNLKTETSGASTVIGYIESGYWTEYDVSVPATGKYMLGFRVSSGISQSTFSVSVDGSTKGTISFAGEPNNTWTQYKLEKLNEALELTSGVHVIRLNFQSAVNVDWIALIPQGVAVISHIGKRYVPMVQCVPSGNGFDILLPGGHNYDAYSLIDCGGRILNSSALAGGISKIHIPKHTGGTLFVTFTSNEERITKRIVFVN